jgi:outer membrane biosynthesis protein TonB
MHERDGPRCFLYREVERTYHIFITHKHDTVIKITIKSKDMRLTISMISFGLLMMASACNDSQSKKTDADTTKVVAADTTAAVAPPAEPPAPVIDSAAITKEYLAARKSTKPPKPKKQGKNEVEMYSEPPMPTHEALEQPAPAKGAAPQVIHTKEFVYYIPSQKASFPGGDAALAAFINKKLIYPEDALKYHVEGTVFAEVYLDSLGNVTKVEVPGTHLGSGLEEETIAVLMESPRWHPAKENGQMVASKVTLPVTYKITH